MRGGNLGPHLEKKKINIKIKIKIKITPETIIVKIEKMANVLIVTQYFGICLQNY